MGYFSNGSEGCSYESFYCERCVHMGGEKGPGCMVWFAHLMCQPEEDGPATEILDMLIPRSADGLSNEQCRMFYPNNPKCGPEQPDLFKEAPDGR